MPIPTGGFLGTRSLPPRSGTWARGALVTLMVATALGAGGDRPSGTEAGGRGVSSAAAAAVAPDRANLEERVRRLEESDAAVREQNRRLAEQNCLLAEQNRQLARQLQDANQRHEELTRRLDRMSVATTPPLPDSAPAPLDGASHTWTGPWAESISPPSNGSSSDEDRTDSKFRIGGYDAAKGRFILVQPQDPERTPFALNFDLITELRYTGFSRSARTWTNSAGMILPVKNYDTIELNRNWLQFSGYALDPRLEYTAVVFSTSTVNRTLLLGWLDYRFSKAFTLSGGYYKLPGSREWYDSFRYTVGADRTMATTFFRPSMSPGIWASGEPLTDLHYIAMVANSFNGLDLAGNRIDTNMAYATSVWWEPWGKFGPGPSDTEWHDRATARLGSSLTVSRELLPGPNAVQSNPENTLFRLSDGTPLSTIGALAPGVTIQTASVQLWALDAAVKYRGLSLSGEYYLRWLDHFRSIGGPLSTRSLFDNGAYAQASYFVVPKRVEGYARCSFVTGPFGSGDEWSGGLNWYVLGQRNWRMTFDVTRINHSPADNILTGYRAGESGTLFQLQMLTDF